MGHIGACAKPSATPFHTGQRPIRVGDMASNPERAATRFRTGHPPAD